MQESAPALHTPLSRRTIARLVQLAGLFDVVTAVIPPRHGRLLALMEFVPAAGILSARTATALVGLLLVYIGSGLRRGKRRAWQVATVLSALATVLHLAKGLDYDAAVVSALLLVTLLATRDGFTAPADRGSRWRALTVFLGFTGAGFALGLAEIAVRMNRLVGHPGVADWVKEAALGLVGLDGPIRYQHPFGAEAVSLTTGASTLLAAGLALIVLLQPGSRVPGRTPDEDLRLRELLRRHGSADSLGYFAMRADKSLIWSPDGAAAVAYRVVRGVSLASGDPLGPQSAWPGAIGAWLRDAAAHGWTPAVLGCGRAGGTAYRRAGLDVIELGDEAVVDATAFRLDGRPMRGVRQAVNRIGRAGYTCRVARQRELTEEEMLEAARAVEAFRDGRVERGFAMALSRFGEPGDGDCLLALCRDEDGHLRGLLQFVPWGDDGLSLDLMRADRTAANGVTELMVVEVLRAAPGLGVRRVSLNFAVLRSVFARADELGAGPVLRLGHRVLKRASKVWQIESLYRANAKYHPAWEPRYLCFPVARDLPRVAVAALTAEAFLPAPARRSRTRSPAVLSGGGR
ncbi:phosphatidylglycerol lysyltransferase domain-containing protein [Couchioplanes caeruleus]|uniref:phosphatidylglycerol lysyltransferase domain-containing protein n=1 Tax=Couchioplanes caeruleus TaxID=56438 RepID=UPI0020C125A9|nr:phosphatidylglycerol lysyltransferase domain-containing protein [Couchioplanes caeruleus]UQU62400.1 phosphatidylglycerol lysyltransferase domain-containing protein [Couchioplanes caeruleus]